MKKNPKVSIGLPVYNGENFIEEAICSILEQTYQNFELIISDNASVDNTRDICRKYVELDSRVSYYRNSENIGAAGNYRRVFHLSSLIYPVLKEVWKQYRNNFILWGHQFLNCDANLSGFPEYILARRSPNPTN